MEPKNKMIVLTPENFKSVTHEIIDNNPIDAGTMGAVYRAVNTATPKRERVCIKLSAPNASAQEKMNHRGITQSESVAKESGFGGAHLITSRPYLTIDGVPYAEMRELSGNLSNYLKPGISMEQKIQFIRDLTTGLIEQHQIRGETHNDIRDRNILVLGKKINGLDRLVLADCGNASAIDSERTEPRDNLGHWATTAPELVKEGSHPTLESDYRSAGAVIYQILTGKLPLEGILSQAKDARQFLRETPLESLDGYIKADIDQCEKPFRELFYKLLDSDPEKRPHSDAEFKKEIDKAIRRYEKSQPLSRSKRWGAIALAALALGTGTWFGVNNYQARENLLKQVQEKEKNLTLTEKIGHIRLYASGSSGFDTSGAIARKIIQSWEEKFGDKKTAFVAYLNPQIVYDAIAELNLPTNAPIKYNSIEKYIEKNDEKTYLAMFDTMGYIDNFVHSDLTFGDKFVNRRWSEAATNYIHRKFLEAQQNTNNNKINKITAPFR